MKKILTLLAVLLIFTIDMEAQRKIQVSKFERNVTSLIGSMTQVKDNSGEVCAVLRVRMTDNDFEVEANLGDLKKEVKTGEMLLWVPIDTKRLIIRHPGVIPYSYEIPMRLEPRATYDMELELVEEEKAAALGSNTHFYVHAGYNVLSISGPAAGFGIKYKQHLIEVGVIVGLNKTEDLYFYNSTGNMVAANNYQAFRISGRYGYECILSDIISITPEVGVAYNMLNGNNIAGTSSSSYKNGSSISALVGARLAVGLTKSIWLHMTPEYDFGLTKDNVCKLVSDNDKTFKSWTEGLSLNVGVLVFF